jgi:hypothetical protein
MDCCDDAVTLHDCTVPDEADVLQEATLVPTAQTFEVVEGVTVTMVHVSAMGRYE